MTVSHPSMRRAKMEQRQSTTQKPEVYVVDNAGSVSQSANEDILSVNERASEEKAKTVKVETETRNLLEALLFAGRATRKVEISGLKFEISTLTQKENSDLVKELYKASDGADLFIIRAITMAYAIKSVNGVPFDEVPLGSIQEEAQFETALDKKLYLLEKMQKNVVEKLHDEYIDLVDKSEVILEKDSGQALKNL